MKIGFDIMGGDYAPEEAIRGVLAYLQRHQDTSADLQFILLGKTELALPYLSLLDDWKAHFTMVPCNTVIGMQEHATKALKEKPDSSIAVGLKMLQEGEIDAFISAGNTGAMMVGALYTVKGIPGILRPTIASPIPNIAGKFNLLLDVGANADCKPEHLVQFAELGKIFTQTVYDLENPRVGLLNIGEEEGKGNILAQAVYPLLKAQDGIHFVGNVEGRDLFLNTADVIVCEGFTGNVALKMAESIYQIFREKRALEDPFLEQFNYEIYGGTPILGVNAPVIIGHGISTANAFSMMLENARKITERDLVGRIKQHFQKNLV